MSKLVGLLLVTIIIISISLRFYKLGEIPLSISWDEAAVGYNAWSIVHYGQDEWGNKFPLVFKSFEDDKHPVHIYFTALSVLFFGISEFSTRLPSAVFGVFNVVLLFYLSYLLFKNYYVSLLSSLSLAISPYNIQFSRFNHELNFAVFFYLLGLIFFLIGIRTRKWCLVLAILSFGIDLLVYQSSLVVVPLTVGIIFVLYFKELFLKRHPGGTARFKNRSTYLFSLFNPKNYSIANKKYLLIGLITVLFFALLLFTHKSILGGARIQQTGIKKEEIFKTDWYKKTNILYLGAAQIVFQAYLSHFSSTYLWISGDVNPRHSPQSIGTFYIIETIFLSIGAIGLVLKRSKITILLFAWALTAPLPASLVGGAPHAGRALYMTGSWHLIIGLGIYCVFVLLKKKPIQYLFLIGLLFGYIWQMRGYLQDYYTNYPIKYAHEWQYGMKQIAKYVKQNPKYSQVFMTDIRSQPYIFFLYYLKYPTIDYLREVQYNDSNTRGHNLVANYNKYYFGLWDVIDSTVNPGVLYIVGPNDYGGLKNRLAFKVKELVRNPNGTDGFFIVSAD